MAVTASHRIKLIKGDITKLRVDAVVTAANEALVGGHGVDGAIHRADSPSRVKYCFRKLNGKSYNGEWLGSTQLSANSGLLLRRCADACGVKKPDR